MDKAFVIKINELIDEVNKLNELNMKQVKEIIGSDINVGSIGDKYER